ncbi:hypothetical protein BOX15_Mlig005023g1 [Macrostomum lignano]|uniref:Uncharacterized protein n=1 Tax=Macrostomum lignano TaxID=282301 RepID=A0A267FCC6_9PLAT|nr:hypothetical protein BOX15_Mlig005023g2 [Macrostomum lignano]PAA73350.1 hypothetical protein BOX15_Mlig005023g1 [Macrostomum lignano]
MHLNSEILYGTNSSAWNGRELSMAKKIAPADRQISLKRRDKSCPHAEINNYTGYTVIVESHSQLEKFRTQLIWNPMAKLWIFALLLVAVFIVGSHCCKLPPIKPKCLKAYRKCTGENQCCTPYCEPISGPNNRRCTYSTNSGRKK